MEGNENKKKVSYCRECGAEIASNETVCRGCGARVTDGSNNCTSWKVLSLLLGIVCIACLVGFKSIYNGGFNDGLKQGEEIGTNVTTQDYEKRIEELNENHSVELEETYKQGKKDGVADYKEKLKKRKEESKKKKQKNKKREDKKKQQEETKAEQDTEESSLTSDLKDAWHKLTGAYVPTEDEIIDISTAQVLAEFDENQVACKQKYDGKYVRVTDTINSIGTTVWGDTYISIGSDIWDDIQCFMYKDQIDKVANCSEGTQVTVVGWVDCGSMNFKIGDARITNF